MRDSDEEESEDWNKPVDPDLPESTDKGLTTCHSRKQSNYNDSDHPRVILHIDIDCFYAQVEMIRDPHLRNKPLGIQQKYIVVTCNYPARERGVTKLMLISDAKEKCPDLVLVSGEDLTNYREMSYKISNYLQKYCPLVERLGFDENFLDITELVTDRISANSHDSEVKGHVFRGGEVKDMCGCGCHGRLMVGSQVAADIREGLFNELGITSCGGIAVNKLLSKLVAGKHKPNQQTTLYPEQTAILMGELTNVRQIPGIGHTTGKRLKNIDILTVQDLQNVDKTVLEEEFGLASADNMKNLCFGIDEGPVIAFGLPQTLSDEDSFRKCSSVVEVKKKLKELITSLLDRLLTDGRTPHTFRLTVRKLSTEHKYPNRESRQCPLLGSLFRKLTKESLPNVCSQLETQAYSLFVKLIDTKQPFHLTLINVAFAKLEQKPCNSIAEFFSPNKSKVNTGCSQDLKNSVNNDKEITFKNTKVFESKENSQENSDPEDFTDKVGGDSRCTSDKLVVGKSVKTGIGATCNEKVKPGLLKWFCNPTHSANSVTASSGLVTGLSQPSKRKSGGLNNETDVKRLKPDTSVESCASGDGFEGDIPDDIDKSVFLQLPPEIQKEILQESKQKLSHASASYNVANTGTYQNKSECSNVQMEASSMHDRRTSQGVSFFSNVNKRKSLQSASKSFASSEKLTTRDKEFTSTSSDKEHASPMACDSEKMDNSPSLEEIPPHIDKAVFQTLPEEIQTELIEDWKRKENRTTISIKSPAPSTTSNILSYFPKTNKQ